MPLIESDARRRSPSSLALRVTLGTAVSAGVVAVLAAAASLFVAERLVRDAEDTRLRGMANVVALELPRSGTHAAVAEAIVHEEQELVPASIRIAVRDASSLVGGDARLPAPPAGSCSSLELADATLRACAVQAGTFRVIAASTRVRQGNALLLLSCLAAAVVAAAVVAALLGWHASRWALAPLTRLRDSLAAVVAEDPRAVTVAGDDACREVATLRAALESLLTRLADAMDAARSFSADAAHELKTPLTVLRAELDLLAEERLDAEARASVDRSRARVASMVALIERLLSFAIAAGHARLASEAVSLEDVAREMIDRLEPSARDRVRLEAETPGMVLGDETLLATLIDNAADNALKFSGDGPVSIRVREVGESVILDVRDHGPGIQDAERARAFEVFFRTPASRAGSTPGHGIGLALVARIAVAHGGSAAFVDVDLDADEPRGAQLRVILPAWSPRPP